MEKIYYPSDLDSVLYKKFEKGRLYQCLRTGEVLNSPVSRVWRGNIQKTSLSCFQNTVVPWQRQWDTAAKRLARYNIFVHKKVDDKYQYRIYTRVVSSDIRGIFRYLGKEADLNRFLEYERMLFRIHPDFSDLLYRTKSFREWIYGLHRNVSNVSLKEEDHTPAEWAKILLNGIISRCKNIPLEKEYSRNVYLPFLHSKFLERNTGMVRKIYNIVTGSHLETQKDLELALNVTFGDPVFRVFDKTYMYLDAVQLNERYGSNPPDTVLFSENDKPIKSFDFGHAVVIGGVGWAISQFFEKCPWFPRVKHMYYWGDCDMAGYGMLNMVREYRKDIVSVLMDRPFEISGERVMNDACSTIYPSSLENLNRDEMQACLWIKQEKARIEQESFSFLSVNRMLKEINGW